MEIVYQDRRIVVAVKPSGVLSTDEPGGAPELLRAQLGTECIRTVHRLDAQVAGLMVFARSARAASILSEQVRERRFGKEYLAVVHGEPPEERGVLRDLLGRDGARRMTYVAREPGRDVREAELAYETVDRRGGLSLVRIRLHTGRTHQIRVHMASIGHPVLGDPIYGGDTCPFAKKHRDLLPGQLLHAAVLHLTHPVTGREMQFSAPLPQNFEEVLRVLRQR